MNKATTNAFEALTKTAEDNSSGVIFAPQARLDYSMSLRMEITAIKV